MGKFEDRVHKIVEDSQREILSLFQDGVGPSSLYSLDDIYKRVSQVLGLTQEIKSELNRVEHSLPAKKNDDEPASEGEPTTQDDRSALRRFWDWYQSILSENKRIEEEMGLPTTAEIYDQWIQRLSEIAPLIQRAGETTKFVISNILRSWLLTEKLKPLEKALSIIKKEQGALSSQLAKCCSDTAKAVNQLSSKLDQSVSSITQSLTGSEERITSSVDSSRAQVQSSIRDVNQLVYDESQALKSKIDSAHQAIDHSLSSQTDSIRNQMSQSDQTRHQEWVDLTDQIRLCCMNTASLISELSQEVVRQGDSTRGIITELSGDVGDVQATTDDINRKVDLLNPQISELSREVSRQGDSTRGEMTELSGDVGDVQATTDDINRKVDLLDPVTNANNVLEILQRQKAIQAALSEIRGLL